MVDMDTYKEAIPEFVFKLHHILEKNEYKEFITWTNDDTEILIKNPKKLEDKVLPYFFRHKHLSSFIRQLNMYKFNKVNKISKERSHMYFKNDYFRRGQFEEMKKIKRNQKQKKNEGQVEEGEPKIEEDSHGAPEPSIKSDLTIFKNEAQSKFAELQQILNQIVKKHPSVKEEISHAIRICEEMKGDSIELIGVAANSMNNIFNEGEEENHKELNLLGTVRDFPPVIQSMIYPSLCSLANLDM